MVAKLGIIPYFWPDFFYERLTMITFLVSITVLIAGYFIYGRYIERFFGASPEIMPPARRMADGVDYKELKPWRIFIIQFLNIAGLGPIFGAVLGAAYGPVAYLWIVLGCIFMGAAHDYFSGMLSVRNDGMSLPDMVGKYLGPGVKKFLLIFTSFILIAVGVSFVTGPADLMQSLTGWDKRIWLYVIFAYYIIATLLPIDKIIGRIYPFMGAILLFMAVAVASAMVWKGFSGEVRMVELTADTFRNFHSNPEKNVLIPMMFIVISCGAISGFHSTQSPIMSRCLGNEKYGRPIFYGAMIAEGIVAMIWATAAMAYFNGPEGLNAAADGGMTPAIIVDTICKSWLGKVGAVIAILGVVVCPITSGDTAFRSLRLVIADSLKYNQKPIANRIFVALPVFVIAFILCKVDFSTIWKYVGIGNQVLATVVLWTSAAYLAKSGKSHIIMSIPATMLTFVCVSYFIIAPYSDGGLFLPPIAGYIAGGAVAAGLLALFLIKSRKTSREIKVNKS